ncbi:hypothetical protein [Prauserella rugosa]|uniref:Uncharacterized protein n=1 Tax=Prauserella rugosa TaxID=43354 RepID=A0A660C8I7_9PSEU|nr:hypothetical protein [Prauserella rugosa]KMS91494.1 hypothetical protein ACZ91_09390 [Streptomyces regensis]TWH15959.1 hypothetical protein JD82_04947 [Prauserella rugosa]
MSSEYQYRVKRDGDSYLGDAEPPVDTLEGALGRALSLLLGHARTPTAAVLAIAPADQSALARVDLHCIQPGLVLPVGVGGLTDSVRALLAGGFDGWRVPELPAEPEPLSNRDEQLPLKVRNVLARHHFQWVEEVALVPDRAFQAMRNMGELSLQRLRAAIPAHTPRRDPAGQPLDDESGTVVALSRGRGDAPAEVHRESLVEMITIRGSSNVEAFAAASRWLADHPDQTLFGVDYDYTPYELSDGDPDTHPYVLRLTVG